ncbi:hypothetical protein [Glycomyces buryatensis]|uniref:Uncharacterized protein n=1 Tax=Glycomyces buryatensis TaxID=2570927 RepID=A0A4S8QAQ3_9ACTN|nr:hypothetical protein [Glycomyces buryatensis]THV40581.1 hypothetical protein FAB82_15050 [Glycomyces buryatensis]
MSIKTDLYAMWGARATEAAKRMNETGYYSAEHTINRHKLDAYEDGCRLVHSAEGTGHLKNALRRRMSNYFQRELRDFYARMLNDVETALEGDDAKKEVR